MSSASEEKRYLNFGKKLAYGSGDFAANCCYGLVSSFILLYLTSAVGLNAGIVGTLMLVARILDGISDVLFGRLIDNTHSKMGKARPWMLYAQIGVSLCLFLIFAIPSMKPAMQYVYFFVFYVALNAIFNTANNVAYSALTALITKNPAERVELGSYRFIFAIIANIIMGFAVTAMVAAFGGGVAGWRMTALIFAIIGLVVNTVSALSVKEIPEEEFESGEFKAVEKKEKASFKDTLKILVTNKYYLIIVLIYIFYYITSNLATGAGVFFAKYYWDDESKLGIMNLMLMFPVIISLIIAPGLVKKTGSMQKVNLVGFIISLVMYIPMFIFAGKKMFLPFLIFMFLRGFFSGALQGSLNAMIAEVSEFSTHKTGIRMDGMMYSCSSLGIKVGSGIGTALTGWLLAMSGFDGNLAVQPVSAVNMTMHLCVTVPLIIATIITILLYFLDVEKQNKLWKKEHAEAEAEA